MKNKFLDLINEYYPLTKQNIKEFEKVKVGIMKFYIEKYNAENFGNVSIMNGVGMFGLMKMDTIIINPFEKDMALFSYDIINIMNNETLFLEQYDTLLDESYREIINENMSILVNSFDKVENEPYISKWYDSLYLDKVSFKKKSKKIKNYFDSIALEYLMKYLDLSKEAKDCDETLKKEKARQYTEGLLLNGGPSTDVFRKKKGQEFTEKFFREVLFGTNKISRN